MSKTLKTVIWPKNTWPIFDFQPLILVRNWFAWFITSKKKFFQKTIELTNQ